MKLEQIFPSILIILQFGASVVCLINGNYRMFVYWLAAAILNTAVTL